VEDIMPILDSQVHAYERNHPGRPWIGTLYGPPEVTGDQMVAAMDAVGVDGAILVSPFSMYRYDASYAIEVFAAHPRRFRLVKPVDPTDPAVVDTIADWAATDGTVGIRIFLRDNASTDPADPASTVSWPALRSTHYRSTWRVQAAWTRRDSSRREIPIHGW
jgi:L-fuconolactonase